MKTESSVWVPYEATRQDPWDLRKVAHLHRRAGFGGTWKELHLDLAAGPAASIERLFHVEPESQQSRLVSDALTCDRRQSEPIFPTSAIRVRPRRGGSIEWFMETTC